MALKTFLFLVALVLSSHAHILPEDLSEAIPIGIAKRAACNADNALRNLRDKRYSSSASIFCSVFLQSTITNTLTAAATSPPTVTATPPAKTITISQSVIITNSVTTFTTLYPPAESTFVKRGDNIPYPPWISATYPISRTTLAPLTSTVTSSFTSTVSAISTSVIIGPPIACGPIGCSNGPGFFGQQAGLPDVASCKSACAGMPTCKSYQFGIPGSTSICNLYTVEVAVTYAPGHSTDDICKTFKFYDIQCVV
ncbi:hypothetical protein ABW20_dc0107367 [Dactylellina cionopaga]|nr:hypothetical protein ABW20_dc0107367 [Dactylellina cionopaga]